MLLQALHVEIGMTNLNLKVTLTLLLTAILKPKHVLKLRFQSIKLLSVGRINYKIKKQDSANTETETLHDKCNINHSKNVVITTNARSFTSQQLVDHYRY